jgi:hypothetical protein
MFAIISAHSDPHSGGAAVALPFFTLYPENVRYAQIA